MRNKICIHEDCSTRANFNYKGIKLALYCSKHKLENMVDVNNKIAVKIIIIGAILQMSLFLYKFKPKNNLKVIIYL